MEETVVVIMIKDSKTKFLDRELGSYRIAEHENLLYNTYALESDDGIKIFMKITTDKDVSDWEFEAIYDYYDTETILPFVSSIYEEEDCFNPTWEVSFDFVDDQDAMEDKISKILNAHYKELESVYETISDKRDEY